ncbi:hypothetical protein, partial [Georgenia thermotolerans]
MDVDLEELAAIIEQLDKTEFTDFLYEKGSLRIHVRRGGLLPDVEVALNGAARSAAAPPDGEAQPRPEADGHAGAAPTGSAPAATA